MMFFETLDRLFDVEARFWLFRASLAAAILFLGWIVASLLRRTSVKLLRRLRVDEGSEKIGLDDFLIQGGVRYTASSILGLLIFWLSLYVVLIAMLAALGIEASEAIFSSILAFLPNVLIAIVILIVGVALSRFIRSLVNTYLNNIQMKGAKVFGVLSQFIVLLFVVSLVLEQLQLGGAILVAGFQILFGSACLALAISFGLGGRRVAQEIIEKVWKK